MEVEIPKLDLIMEVEEMLKRGRYDKKKEKALNDYKKEKKSGRSRVEKSVENNKEKSAK